MQRRAYLKWPILQESSLLNSEEREQEILERHIKSLIVWNTWNGVMEEEVMKMLKEMLKETRD